MSFEEDQSSKKRKLDAKDSCHIIKTNEEGEKFWDLGNSRRATLRDWKGKPWIDIREFYGQEPDLKPGKKGIFLSLDQFKQLVKVSDNILDSATKAELLDANEEL